MKEEAEREREAVAARSQALEERKRELQQRADEVRRSVERGWKVAHVLSFLRAKKGAEYGWEWIAFMQVEREGRAAARLKELAEAAAREVDQGMCESTNFVVFQEFVWIFHHTECVLQ